MAKSRYFRFRLKQASGRFKIKQDFMDVGGQQRYGTCIIEKYHCEIRQTAHIEKPSSLLNRKNSSLLTGKRTAI